MKPTKAVYELKVSLQGAQPVIWRWLQAPERL